MKNRQINQTMYILLIFGYGLPKGLQIRYNKVSTLIVGGTTPLGRKAHPIADFLELSLFIF